MLGLYAFSRMTLCGKENGHFQTICIDKTCETYGTESICDHLIGFLAALFD